MAHQPARRATASLWHDAAMEAGTVATPETKYQRAYVPPNEKGSATLRQLVEAVRPLDQQQRLGFSRSDDTRDITLCYAGKLDLVRQPCIAVVGTRKVSREGGARARRLARELVGAGIVVVSGLAQGVDTEALSTAIDAGGSAVSVIGTPLNVVYPAANKRVAEDHPPRAPIALPVSRRGACVP